MAVKSTFFAMLLCTLFLSASPVPQADIVVKDGTELEAQVFAQYGVKYSAVRTLEREDLKALAAKITRTATIASSTRSVTFAKVTQSEGLLLSEPTSDDSAVAFADFGPDVSRAVVQLMTLGEAASEMGLRLNDGKMYVGWVVSVDRFNDQGQCLSSTSMSLKLYTRLPLKVLKLELYTVIKNHLSMQEDSSTVAHLVDGQFEVNISSISGSIQHTYLVAYDPTKLPCEIRRDGKEFCGGLLTKDSASSQWHGTASSTTPLGPSSGPVPEGYLYVESGKATDVSSLSSRQGTFTGVSFQYHMSGNDPGSLVIEGFSSPPGMWLQKWRSNGTQQSSKTDRWRQAHVTFDDEMQLVRVVAVPGEAGPGTTAIAAVKLTASVASAATPDFLMYTLTQHTSRVRSVVFSPDGQLIASGSVDATTKVWNATTGQLLRTLKVGDAVVRVAFFPDGEKITTGAVDGTLKVWSVRTGQLSGTIMCHSPWALSPRGHDILCPHSRGHLILWDVDTGQQVKEFPDLRLGSYHTLAFAADGAQIVAVGSRAGATVFATIDAATGSVVHQVQSPGSVTDATLSPDLKQVVSCVDAAFRRQDVQTAKTRLTWSIARQFCSHVAFSPDGQQLVSVNQHALNVWAIATGRLLRTLSGHDANVLAVAFSPDGRHIVSGSRDSSIKMWRATPLPSAAPGAAAATPPPKPEAANLAHLRLPDMSPGLAQVHMPGMAPDAMAVHEAFPIEGDVLSSGPMAAAMAKPRPVVHAGAVLAVIFVPDGRQAVSYSADSIAFWDTASGELNRTVTMEGAPAAVCAAFAPDAHHVASGGMDHAVRLWTTRGSLVHRLEGHSGYVRAVAFSPDGEWVASGSADRTVLLWHLKHESGVPAPVHTLKGHHADIAAVAFSPDGQHVISGGDDGTVRVWTTTWGNTIHTLPGAGPLDRLVALAVAPDGGQVATSSLLGPHGLQLRSTHDGKAPVVLDGHNASVLALAFAPTGRHVVSGSADRTLKVWDPKAGRVLGTMAGHSGRIVSVAVSPDGNQVVSGSDDNSVRLWVAPTDHSGAPALTQPTSALYSTTTGNISWSPKLQIGVIHAAAFSPDGQQVAASSALGRGHRFCVYSRTGELVHTLCIQCSAAAIAFTADGQMLAAIVSDPKQKVLCPCTCAPAHVPMPSTHPLPMGCPCRTPPGYCTVLCHSPEGATPATRVTWLITGTRVCANSWNARFFSLLSPSCFPDLCSQVTACGPLGPSCTPVLFSLSSSLPLTQEAPLDDVAATIRLTGCSAGRVLSCLLV